ncbi:MAG: AMP-binding protein [Alphaproteobacteria bacterium]|nr:AMP-binding protein [Alphaproteobacteria bacterium]
MSLKAVDRVMGLTIGDAFRRTVDRFPDNSFLAAPSSQGRGYHEAGFEMTYGAASRAVDTLVERYREAGYGAGHRIALALDNRPEHVLHRLALNTLGISCVPINPDYRAGEMAYLLDHSDAALVVHLERHRGTITDANAQLGNAVATWSFEAGGDAFPHAPSCGACDAIRPETEAQLLYTSGTTGRPKGCIMSHQYELLCGSWYANLEGPFAFREGLDRVYNPLPLYHLNSGVVSILGMMLIGGCQIQPDRFHPRSWWRDVVETKASIIHYLGVVAPMLLNQPDDPLERAHEVRFGWGAGIEPGLHAVFEERFGFPMVELWGMTEMCRVLRADSEPRKRGTRAMGRAVPGLDVEIRDEADNPLPDGEPGEMVVRFSAENPRLGAFSGYLKDEAATEEAWRGGWFHTGDTVLRAEDGMLHFVDRKKNIIRRSGENIAAAEVEATLQVRGEVAQVAVLAVPDPTREEEVLACVVPAPGVEPTEALARTLFEHCNQRLAYFKPPGWIKFVEDLPMTGSQKIQKHRIFEDGVNPLTAPGMIDLRALKRRG